MNESKSFKVSIFGEIYSLVSDQSEEHIQEASRLVDQMMKEIARGAGLQDPKRVAVLVALRLASMKMLDDAETQSRIASYQALALKIDQTLGAL